MRIADFSPLISNMPVSSQAFASKRSTWSTYLNREDVAGTALRSIFGHSNKVFLSRSDLREFASRADLAEFVIATIIWGYPRGMRGNHFASVVVHLEPLCELLSAVRSCPINDWNSHYEMLRPINGIGLSTYTKLLHFLSVKVGRRESLILDQRIIDTVKQSRFEELAPIRELNSSSAPRRYPEYLECLNHIALQLSVSPENIEFFLFEFGLHLKSENGRSVARFG